MKLYSILIHETGENLCVAARTSDHAAEVLATFWCARSGTLPGRFDVESGPPAAYCDNSFVRLVADGELAGIVICQIDGSMIFEPADC